MQSEVEQEKCKCGGTVIEGYIWRSQQYNSVDWYTYDWIEHVPVCSKCKLIQDESGEYGTLFVKKESII